MSCRFEHRHLLNSVSEVKDKGADDETHELETPRWPSPPIHLNAPDSHFPPSYHSLFPGIHDHAMVHAVHRSIFYESMQRRLEEQLEQIRVRKHRIERNVYYLESKIMDGNCFYSGMRIATRTFIHLQHAAVTAYLNKLKQDWGVMDEEERRVKSKLATVHSHKAYL